MVSIGEVFKGKGLMAKAYQKAICPCGEVIDIKNWHMATPHLFKCNRCKNDAWATSTSKLTGWSMLDDRLEVYPEDERFILIGKVIGKYQIDTKTWKVYTRETEKMLAIDAEEFNLFIDGKPADEDQIRKFIGGSQYGYYTIPLDNEVDKLQSQYNKLFPRYSLPQKYDSALGLLTDVRKTFDQPKISLLVKAGLKNAMDLIVNPEGTNPQQLLGMSKATLRYARERELSAYEIRDLKSLEEIIGPNLAIDIFGAGDRARDIPLLVDLIQFRHPLREGEEERKRVYTDIPALMDYLNRGLIQQGLPFDTIARELRDYVSMAIDLETHIEKYPRSVRLVHDLTQRDYKVMENEITKRKFIEIAEEAKEKYEYKDKEYVIVVPKEPKDVQREGEVLNHCVAGYVSNIVDKKTTIVFLRRVEAPDEPLVTIEVRDNKVVQKQGGAKRRQMTQEENEFIRKWARAKKINL